MRDKRINVVPDLKYSLQQACADRPAPDWHRLLANEALLVPCVCRYQRTLRLMKMIPTWECWCAEPEWFEICKSMDSTDRKKFKAWWEVIYEAQRPSVVSAGKDDKQAVVFALLVVAQEVAKRDGILRSLDPAKFGIDEEHAQKIVESVLKRAKDLLPRKVAAGVAEASALLRPKYYGRL